MKRIVAKYIFQSRLWYDEHGQDFTEYALLAGMVGITAGALFPPMSDQISEIFSRLNSTMQQI